MWLYLQFAVLMLKTEENLFLIGSLRCIPFLFISFEDLDDLFFLYPFMQCTTKNSMEKRRINCKVKNCQLWIRETSLCVCAFLFVNKLFENVGAFERTYDWFFISFLDSFCRIHIGFLKITIWPFSILAAFQKLHSGRPPADRFPSCDLFSIFHQAISSNCVSWWNFSRSIFHVSPSKGY